MECVQKVSGEVICPEAIQKKKKPPPRINPFANPISEAIKSKQLKLKTYSEAQKAFGCTDVYIFHSAKPILTCEQFKLKFGIPDDYNIPNCTSNDAPLISTTIDAAKLQEFVYGMKLE